MTLMTLFLAAGLNAASVTQDINAPTSNADQSDQNDIIIVTGTRFESAAEDWPQTLQTVDIPELYGEGRLILSEGLEALRGVQTVQSGPAGSQTSLFLRGSNAKHALFLLDGIRLTDPSNANGAFDAGTLSLSGLQWIEVVTGPLSSVYGSDAIGGVVNLIPDRGGREESISTDWQFTAGSDDLLGATVGVRGTTGRLSYGLSGEALQSDGHDSVPARLSTANGDQDGSRFYTLTGVADIAVTDRLVWETLVRWQDSTVEFDTFSGGPSFNQRADDPDLETQSRSEVLRTGLSWNIVPDSLTSRLRAGVVQSDLEASNANGVTDAFEGQRIFAEWLLARQSDQDALDWHIGWQWQDESAESETQFANQLDESEDQWGVFALAQFKPTDHLTLTGSARHDEYERFGSAATWQAGAVLQVPSIHTRFRGSYGTGFKAPTLSERYSSSSFITPNPDLVPEDSQTWELGFEMQWPDAWTRLPITLGGVVYQSDIENLIETEFDFTTFTGQNVNIGEAEIAGYEAFVELEISSTLNASLDYTYTDAINAVTQSRLLRRAPHVWSARLDWRASETLTLFLQAQRLSGWRDVLYNDDGVFVTGNGFQEGYTLLNGAVSYAINDTLSVVASVRNLTDETFEQPAAFAGEPRSVSLAIRFGGAS